MLDFVALFIGAYHFFAITEAGQNPTLLNVVAFIALFVYGVIVIWPRKAPLKRAQLVKVGLILVVIAYTTLTAALGEMYDRSLSQPYEHTHDHPLQVEEALKFLDSGRNPYTENYHDTPMALWNNWIENPALYHFISLPTHIYISIPFYAANISPFGMYDQRIIHIVFFIAALVAGYRMFDSDEAKRLSLIIIGANPLFSPFFVEGLDDVIFLGMILVSLLALKKQWFQWSLIFLALAITTKHTAWFIMPFYGLYLWHTGYLKIGWINKITPSVLIIIASLLPFVIWDARSFYEDVYLYPAGKLETSYPIRGIGLSWILVNYGVIENRNAYFPFIFVQAAVLGPILLLLSIWQWRSQSIGRIVFNYGLLLWGFWFFSRFFNESYAGVLAILLPLGALLLYEAGRRFKTHPAPASAAPSA